MNPKTILAVSALAVALTSCNDKAPEYQSPAADVSEFKVSVNSMAKSELCALDAVNAESPSEGRFKVVANSPVTLEGWAATNSLTNPGAVQVVMSAADKAFVVSGSADIARDDVAKAYSAGALSNSGFRVKVPSLKVPAGEYAVAILHDEAGALVSCASQYRLIVQ